MFPPAAQPLASIFEGDPQVATSRVFGASALPTIHQPPTASRKGRYQRSFPTHPPSRCLSGGSPRPPPEGPNPLQTPPTNQVKPRTGARGVTPPHTIVHYSAGTVLSQMDHRYGFATYEDDETQPSLPPTQRVLGDSPSPYQRGLHPLWTLPPDKPNQVSLRSRCLSGGSHSPREGSTPLDSPESLIHERTRAYRRGWGHFGALGAPHYRLNSRWRLPLVACRKRRSTFFTHPPALTLVSLRDTLNHPTEGAAPPLHSPPCFEDARSMYPRPETSRPW